MSEEPLEAGLYIIPTPIGNLGDITLRAVDTLKKVDLVACEDTRVTGKLLHHLELHKDLMSYRDENEKYQAPKLAALIQEGKSIALVSDAGTPLISDPGFRLVKECRVLELPITTLPGPNACITALAASGLPTDSFLFLGFLPPKSAARKRIFTENIALPYTLIIYESKHRIEKCLNEIIEIYGPERIISVAREMTKLHESIHSGPAGDIIPKIKKGSLKGEFVVLIAKEGFTF